MLKVKRVINDFGIITDTLWTSPTYNENDYCRKFWTVEIIFAHRWFFVYLKSAGLLEKAHYFEASKELKY